MLCDKSLYFRRADKFEDDCEAKSPGIEIHRDTKQVEPWVPRITIASCWTMDERETRKMWEQYVESGEGLLVTTTVGDVLDAMNAMKNDTTNLETHHQISISDVEYICDELYSSSPIYNDRPTWWGFRKRCQFAYENEFRFTIIPDKLIPIVRENASNYQGGTATDNLIKRHLSNHNSFSVTPDAHGINVPIDLGKIIKTVRVHPDSAPDSVRFYTDLFATFGLGTVDVQPSDIGDGA
jgi:hypothetical protein